MDGYLKDLRDAVGNMPIILNFAVACVVDEKNRVLLQARDPEKTKWGFPGGALNYGESFAEAAARECLEETGYRVDINSLIGLYDKSFASYPNGDAQTIVVAYRATLIGGEKIIDNHETFGVEWFDIDTAPELFNEQHRKILADLKLNLK